MSQSSPVKETFHHLHSASPDLVFPLPEARIRPPEDIALEAWLKLAIDERAPVRSLVVLDIAHGHFTAVVVDGGADLLRWRIRGRREQLAQLHDGVLGDAGGHSRGTLIVMAERSHDPCVTVDAIPSPHGDPGPAGRPPDLQLLRLRAQLHAKVNNAQRVTIVDGNQEAQHVGLLRL